MTATRLRRTTGALFAIGAIAFGIAASVLSATFDWPHILRETADVVLPAFTAGGDTLIWTWFATAWTYAILAVPLLLLPRVLGLRDNAALGDFGYDDVLELAVDARADDAFGYRSEFINLVKTAQALQ